MKIIKEALKLAKLQRTSQTEKQIIKSYEIDFRNIDENLKPLKKPIKKVLDIGCGIAGWECCLPDYAKPDIYLIDKTQTDKNIYYGYKPKTSFYNSMEIAKKNLIANGIPEKNIFIYEADNTIPFNEKFDLIVSLISCGFHYPVETYLDQIYNKLKKGGTFNYNCPMYDQNINVEPHKCLWINVLEEELDIYSDNGCNEGLIKRLIIQNETRN